MEPYRVGSPRRASQSSAAAATSSASATREVEAQPASAALKEGIMSCLQGAAAMFATCLPCLSPDTPLEHTETSPLMRSKTPPSPQALHALDGIAISPAAPKTLTERCIQATEGWDSADASFSWKDVDATGMQDAKKNILQNGITPMLQSLLGTAADSSVLQERLATCLTTSPQAYSAEEFGLRIYYASNDLSETGDDRLAISHPLEEIRTAVLRHFVSSNTEAQPLKGIVFPTNPAGPIRVLFKLAAKSDAPTSTLDALIKDRFARADIDLTQETPLSTASCADITDKLGKETLLEIQEAASQRLEKLLSQAIIEDFSNVQGKAFGETVVINQGSAEASVGLHLLTHELMHTLADPETVNTLRGSATMGDEGPNEFFARLASIHAGLDQSTSTEKTPYKLNAAWSDTDLTKTLARAYFLGDAVALASVKAGIPAQ